MKKASGKRCQTFFPGLSVWTGWLGFFSVPDESMPNTQVMQTVKRFNMFIT
jgi:hypothetical protein